jgi:hypothetical protein
MKKLLRKLPRRKSQEAADQPRERITNETVAEHRERILAGGRKFKYPVQVAKHRLVITSVAIGIAAVALLVLLTWQQLYIAQNTSNFMYRITQLVPLQVASVDGYGVRYSDYLKKYRSSVHYLQQQNSINLNSEDGHRQAEFIKRREITGAEKNAYAMKLAGEKNIKVSNKEVNDFIQRDLTAKRVSQEAYERTVLKSFYDWTLDDYRGIVHTELLKRKVSFAVDTTAKERADALHTQLASGTDFAAIAKASSDDVTTKANGGDVGILPIDNQDPNGLIAAAKKLQPNQLSDVITGADGYYLIKLIEKTDATIRYAQIKVTLHAFDDQFATLQKSNKIHEYIKLEQ